MSTFSSTSCSCPSPCSVAGPGANNSARREAVLQQLVTWGQLQQDLATSLDLLRQLTGAMPDCLLLRPVYQLWEAHTKAVAQAVGDRGGWLDWYEFECDMGKTPKEMQHAPADGGATVLVDSLGKLAEVICS